MDNDSNLYKVYWQLVKRLNRRIKTGDYDYNETVKLFFRFVMESSDFYNRKFPYDKRDFSLSDIYTVAVNYADRYKEDTDNGTKIYT